MNEKRQVILVMTDTTRFDMLGCYGNPGMKTPSLDTLCSEGIRFDRAYTTQPVCGPARSAIFTGMFPHLNGAFANHLPLWSGVKTLGQRLTAEGIHCAYIGKWHLDGTDYFGNGKCPDGWDARYWYDMRRYLEELTPEERTASRRGETCLREGFNADQTFGHRCTQRALDFLEKHGEEDFLLVVSYDEPHDPCLCPAPYNTMYKGYTFPDCPNIRDTLEGKPEYQRLWARDRTRMDRGAITVENALYFGCNSFADHEIGRVLGKAGTVAPDAMVIYTSDHGTSLQNHCLNSKGALVYEEVAKIPLIIKPGRAAAAAGEAYKMPVSHLDLAPTIMERMGVKIPAAFHGKSLAPMFTDVSRRINDCVFVEFTRFENTHDSFGGMQLMRAAINDRHKLSINLLDTDELYDNENDPYEMKNRINDPECGDVRRELHEKILACMNRTLDPLRGYQWLRRPWRKDVTSVSFDNEEYIRLQENEEGEPRPISYDTGLEMVAAVRKDLTMANDVV